MATIQSLRIDGKTMPDPALNGFHITREKIWSADTGRTERGTMVGTVVTVKTKLQINWPPLPMEQVAVIEAAVSKPGFVNVTYNDMTGASRSMSAYFGTPTYQVYSWVNGKQFVTVSVDAVEQ